MEELPMKFKSLMENSKFTLVATMPQELEFAEAAVKGGADALKMRCNMNHISNLSAGIMNGPFQERKGFLKEVIDMAGDVPVGLVPGGLEAYVTEAERVEMEEMGFDYFNSHYKYARPYMFDGKALTSVIAFTEDNWGDAEMFRAIDGSEKIDVVEANFVAAENYGKDLTYDDILRHESVVKRLHQPIIATAQKCVRPEEVRYIYETGCKALMIGVIQFKVAAAGGELTPKIVQRATETYREAIDRL
jgi:hypothetical protein